MACVILLNGIGSAGKSTIARALQAALPEIYLHVQLDTFLDMLHPVRADHRDTYLFQETFEDGHAVVKIHTGPEGHRIVAGMRHAVAAMAGLGNNLIVDDVLLGREIEDYARLLKPFRFYKVGVFAPLEVLERRERLRGDRKIGLARGQFPLVHRDIDYDLRVDTSKLDPEACAHQIIEKFALER